MEGEEEGKGIERIGRKKEEEGRWKGGSREVQKKGGNILFLAY